MSLATVIHYCTNDYRFLRRSVEEAKRFSSKIVIAVADHFFNGAPENRPLLEQTYRDFPDCQFLEFAYDHARLYSPYLVHYSPTDREWGFFWHSTSRYLAALFLPKEIEYVLFLDADEIVEGERFAAWLRTGEHRALLAVRFLCYTYVHRADLRSKQYFTSALLARLSALDPDRMIQAEDRAGIFADMPEPKAGFVGEGNRPFIHHYTWVRTREEALRKSETWAHRQDKDWKDAIDRIESDRMDYLGMDFEEAPPFFDPLVAECPVCSEAPSASFPNVFRVDLPWARRRSIERALEGMQQGM